MPVGGVGSLTAAPGLVQAAGADDLRKVHADDPVVAGVGVLDQFCRILVDGARCWDWSMTSMPR